MAVTWTELIDAVAEEASLPKATARKSLEALVAVATTRLESHEAVRLNNLCTLQPVWRRARVLRSLHDKRKMFLDGRWSLTVRPAKRLRDRLVAQSPQHWRDGDHQAA